MQSYLVSSRSSQCHRFFHACWLTLPVRDEIIYSGVNFFPSMKVMSGYGMRQGRSASMEDFLYTEIPMINSQAIGLFGVFDGHNGLRAAEYVKHHLFDNLLQHPKLVEDIKLAIAETFQQTDQEYLRSEINHMDAASTACTCLVVGDHLLVANIGDSRAVICRRGEADSVN